METSDDALVMFCLKVQNQMANYTDMRESQQPVRLTE